MLDEVRGNSSVLVRVDVEGGMVQRGSQLWRDSSVVRALVRNTRDLGSIPSCAA